MALPSDRSIPPQFARQGDPISAAFINLIVRAVRRSMRIVGGQGISVEQRGDLITVGLRGGYQDVQLYRISGIRVSGTVNTTTKGATVTGVQSTISYDIKPYRATEKDDITNHTPALGRVEDDTLTIRSAAVGHPVWVYTLVTGDAETKDLYVEVLSERLDTGSDCPEPAS